MFVQLVLSGVSQGSIYALVALGMTALFRATGVVNFGHGEFFMMGAFFVYALTDMVGLPFAAAAPVAIAGMFLLGVCVERGLIRPMGNAPHLNLAMMAVAMSFLLKGVARLFWGREVHPMPAVFSFPPFEVGDVVVTSQDLIISAVMLLMVALFFIFFNFSQVGRIAQAASENPRGAALVGVNVPAFQSSMWGVAAALGAIAGILVAPITLLYPDMGGQILIRAFAAMTLGGFGNLGGAVVGGFLIGIMEQLAGGYISTAFIDIFAFVAILVVLLIRPRGLFGKPEVFRV